MVAWAAIGIPVNERLVFNTNAKHAFAPGFRLSVPDVIILAIGTATAIALATFLSSGWRGRWLS